MNSDETSPSVPPPVLNPRKLERRAAGVHFVELECVGRPAETLFNLVFVRHFGATLLSISLVLHLFMAISMGAKFWWDTMAYFQLADALRGNSLRTLYEGPFGIIFQHLTPGLPFLILIFERLFGGAMWPAFAVFQNALNVIACVYFATGFSGRISKTAQVAVILLTALFPYFSAFHNAVLTESLSSSLVMIMIGTTIRCLDGRFRLMPSLITVLILGVLGGQIRSYIIAISSGFSFLMIFNDARFRRLWLFAVVAITAVAGTLIFPVYRVAVGIDFFFPRVDALMLMHAHYVNWALDDRSKRAVQGAVLDPTIAMKLDSQNIDLDSDDVVKMVRDLVGAGLTSEQAVSIIRGAAWIVRTQSYEVMGRQLQLSLSSLGFQSVSTCCNPNRLLRSGGYTGEQMRAHLQFYYRWNAGLDSMDYAKQFREYERLYRSAPRYYSEGAIDWYTSRVAPYVLAHPFPWRDFLKLNAIPPDILIFFGLFGLIMMSFNDWKLIFILGLLLAPIYGATVSTVLIGDNRYAHLLWPIYILGIVALFELIIFRVVNHDRRGGLRNVTRRTLL
jgi:hypothetical protein